MCFSRCSVISSISDFVIFLPQSVLQSYSQSSNHANVSFLTYAFHAQYFPTEAAICLFIVHSSRRSDGNVAN